MKTRIDWSPLLLVPNTIDKYLLTNEYESLTTVSVTTTITWIHTNIFEKVTVNSQKTEDVLLRIATGMINNLSLCSVNKTLLHDNMIKESKRLRESWTLTILTNDFNKDVPF